MRERASPTKPSRATHLSYQAPDANTPDCPRLPIILGSRAQPTCEIGARGLSTVWITTQQALMDSTVATLDMNQMRTSRHIVPLTTTCAITPIQCETRPRRRYRLDCPSQKIGLRHQGGCPRVHPPCGKRTLGGPLDEATFGCACLGQLCHFGNQARATVLFPHQTIPKKQHRFPLKRCKRQLEETPKIEFAPARRAGRSLQPWQALSAMRPTEFAIGFRVSRPLRCLHKLGHRAQNMSAPIIVPSRW